MISLLHIPLADSVTSIDPVMQAMRLQSEGWFTTSAMLVMAGLFIIATFAGFVDAIAGGGGLITLPFMLLTGLPPHEALGTQKGQSVFGSGSALLRFFHSPLLDRRRAMQSFVPGLLASAAGTYLVTLVPNQHLAPVVMVLLLLVAIFMIFYRPPQVHEPPVHRGFGAAALVAVIIAGYDGFFGPGTGTFLILAYALGWRDRLDAASANAKVVNFASNLAAVIVFGIKGMIVWPFALPMAAGQVLGATMGAHITIRVGRGLVRVVVIVVSLALLTRLAFMMFG